MAKNETIVFSLFKWYDNGKLIGIENKVYTIRRSPRMDRQLFDLMLKKGKLEDELDELSIKRLEVFHQIGIINRRIEERTNELIKEGKYDEENPYA